MPNKLIILSDHTLFTEGIASRLRQYPERVDFHFINPQQLDYVEQISAIQPCAVIMDAVDSDGTQCCVLGDLLSALENVTVVLLAADQRDVQVIKSSRHQFSGVQELIDVLENHP